MASTIPSAQAASLPTFTKLEPSSSFYDRITSWASEHKAAVYTIAGITLVATGAGIYYYTSESAPTPQDLEAAAEKKKARKENKKAKKTAQREQKSPPPETKPQTQGVYR
jgi:import receptor subunit TOM70